MRLILTLAAALTCTAARADDWAAIMRPEANPSTAAPIDLRAEMEKFFDGYKNTRIREEDGDHPRKATVKAAQAEPQYLKAGTRFMEGGYWYTADGQGRGNWCAECNGISYPDFVRQWEAKRTPVSANPTRPGGSPGFPPSTPITLAPSAATPLPQGKGPGWYAGTMQMAPTPIVARNVVLRGGTSFAGGCATGG